VISVILVCPQWIESNFFGLLVVLFVIVFFFFVRTASVLPCNCSSSFFLQNVPPSFSLAQHFPSPYPCFVELPPDTLSTCFFRRSFIPSQKRLQRLHQLLRLSPIFFPLQPVLDIPLFNRPCPVSPLQCDLPLISPHDLLVISLLITTTTRQHFFVCLLIFEYPLFPSNTSLLVNLLLYLCRWHL